MEFKQITRLPSAVPAARKIPKRQKRRSVSAQMKWVRRFLRSEMDQAEFCRKHKLTPKTFGNWKRKFNQRNTPKQVNNSRTETTINKQTQESLHITLPSGIRIDVNMDQSSVSHFFKALLTCK